MTSRSTTQSLRPPKMQAMILERAGATLSLSGKHLGNASVYSSILVAVCGEC